MSTKNRLFHLHAPVLCPLLMLAMAAAFVPRAAAAPLEAGVGSRSIAPDTTKYHVPLGGYGERQNAPATGIHDYTMAKALILKQGDKKFALVTLDLLGIARSLRDEVVKRIDGTGITSDNLMMAASHSHASVEMNALNSKNVFKNKAIGIYDPKLLDWVSQQIADAIKDANKNFVPIKVGTGSTMVKGMNRNRRGGTITDNQLTLTRIDTMDGKPFVVFINFTAHPTYMNAKVMQISAAWPGYLQREVEGFLDHGVMCMYANGAEGDQSPAGGHGPSPFAKAEDEGRKLAVKALDLYKTVKTSPDVDFEYSMTTLKLPPRTAPPALLDSAGEEYGLNPDNIMKVIDAMSPKTSYLGVLKLGGLVGVAIPGEMAAGLGLQIKDTLRKAGAKHPIIVGLGNEWISYILQPKEYHKGGYEAGVSFYGDQLGPVIVKQAIAAGEAILKK